MSLALISRTGLIAAFSLIAAAAPSAGSPKRQERLPDGPPASTPADAAPPRGDRRADRLERAPGAPSRTVERRPAPGVSALERTSPELAQR